MSGPRLGTDFGGKGQLIVGVNMLKVPGIDEDMSQESTPSPSCYHDRCDMRDKWFLLEG